ncbi:MAG: hypothetical protein E7226_03295 [Clostridiales bacterium]|nr:hypothetical protein [Clostridiales bacterium]
MKKIMKVTLGLTMSVLMLFAFTACGGAAQETPEDQAVAALDTQLAALKSADREAIQELSGGEDAFGDAVEQLGSEEDVDSILKSMFGHFDYTIGTPEKVDDSNVNVPVTVSNADMQKAVDTWFSDLMAYAMQNPDIANDEKALQAKTIELLQASVDKTAEAEDGIVTNDVVFPMTLIDGKWEISDTIDEGVLDAVLGGFMTAINDLTGQMGE